MAIPDSECDGPPSVADSVRHPFSRQSNEWPRILLVLILLVILFPKEARFLFFLAFVTVIVIIMMLGSGGR
jgi:hypothetical protein